MGTRVRAASLRFLPAGRAAKGAQYTEPMSVLDAKRHHEHLVDELIAEVEGYNPDVDKDLLRHAFDVAERAHEGQTRRSGEEFIHHPLGVARICAELHLDEQTIAAALLHDVVEDTGADLEEIRAEFGAEIAQLVEGVTKLTRITFQSREQAEAENYRKMIVAMAQDVRVILIKLADRLHNMRTIEYQSKQKQGQKARETLEVYAPLAHRLGIHALKWELEDLAFQTLHPRKYAEIKAMVADQRADREAQADKAAEILGEELGKADVPAEITARAKHLYSIYDKMAKRGREFNEIYDLTAMRVVCERDGEEGTRDCYAALGLVHSLWKPMPGRFKDFIAMPKLNRYRSLHTTVIGPEGKPLEIQVRTRQMHEEAEYGVAAHWLYKRGRAAKADDEWLTWVKSLMDWQQEDQDPGEYMRNLRTDLFADEVYVFTPKGEVKVLPSGATPIDFAYAVHTDVGHRTVGAKVNGRIVPLHYRLTSGDFVEILTSKSGPRPVTRLARARHLVARAQQDPAVVPARDARRDRGEGPRAARPGAEGAEAPVPQAPGLERARPGDPRDGLQEGGGLLRRPRRREAPAGADRQQGHPAPQDRRGRGRAARSRPSRRGRRRRSRATGSGSPCPGVEDVLVRLAKCCTPVAGRPGRRLHLARARDHGAPRGLPEREGAPEEPGAVHAGRVGGRRLGRLPRPDLGRRLGPRAPARGRRADVRRARREHRVLRRRRRGRHGAQLVHGRGGGREGAALAARPALRNLDAVFDAYRVTPS